MKQWLVPTLLVFLVIGYFTVRLLFPANGSDLAQQSLEPATSVANDDRYGSSQLATATQPVDRIKVNTSASKKQMVGRVWLETESGPLLLDSNCEVSILPRSAVSGGRREQVGNRSPALSVRTFMWNSDEAGTGGGIVADPGDVETYTVEYGEWRQPVPEEAMIVVAVRHRGRELSVTRGASFSRSQVQADLYVEDVPAAILSVVDGVTGRPLNRVEVLASTPFPDSRPIKITFGGGGWSTLGSTRNAPLAKRSAEPPAESISVCNECNSPVKVPFSRLERTLWIGKPGYQWGKLLWAPETTERVIELFPTGSLQIQLLGTRAIKGKFDVLLAADSELVCSWIGLRGDAVLTADALGARDLRLSVRRTSYGLTSTILTQLVVIEAGRATEITIDVGDFAPPDSAAGSIDLRVLTSDYIPTGMPLNVSIMPLDQYGPTAHPLIRVLLSTLPASETGFDAPFTHIPPGRYLVSLDRAQVACEVEVLPQSSVACELDIREIATIKVWPSGDYVEGQGCPGTLLWWSENGDGVFSSYGLPKGIGEALWFDGCWTLSCMPGELQMIVVEPSSGSPLGSLQRELASAGLTESAYSIASTAVVTLDFVLKDCGPDDVLEVARRIDRSLISAERGARPLRVSITDEGGIQVVLSKPGDYRFELGDLASSIASPDAGSVLAIRSGVRKTVTLTRSE